MKYLITGGTGFLGQRLLKEFPPEDTTVIGRNEGKLVEVQERYGVNIIAGDIADEYVCDKACRNVNSIFHLGAFKFMDLAEIDVKRCIDSNVVGTMNLLEMTRKHRIQSIIGISTDKAEKVSGVYGATKLLMEGLFRDYEKMNPDTRYRIVRFGNIFNSTGSVIDKWKTRIKFNAPIKVTDLEATRFFWTVDDAVELIFECLAQAKDSTPYMTGMKALRIGDLLDVVTEKYGQATIQIIGLRKGENRHESINGIDSLTAERYTKEELWELV